VTSLLGVLLLVALGLPLSFAVTRAWPLAVVFAPLGGAAVATGGVVLMIVVGGPLLPWIAPVFVLTGVAAWRVRRRAPAGPGTWRDALLITVPLVPPFLPMFRQPLLWDAHMIWWLHAGYFEQGGDFTRRSMGNAALAFSHQDYPPLASAPVALVWRVLGTHEFYPAAIVSGVLTFSAAAAAVYAVRLVTAGGPALVSWGAAVAVGWSAFSPLWMVPTAGFSDAMCAAAFAAGVVLLLLGREPFGATLPLAMLLLCSAALMKNEGLSMVLALGVVGTWKYRRSIRRIGWVWLPVGVAGVWSAVARATGARTDVLSGGRFEALLHGDPDTAGRFPHVFATMAGRVDWIVGWALAAAVLGLLALRRRRAELGIGGDLWLWAVAGLYWCAVTLIYMITPMPLQWHLSTSVDRVVILIVVLACASAACWGVTALSAPAAVAQTDDAAPVPAQETGARV
jgi:MYXO-CTERM domain-containing protein